MKPDRRLLRNIRRWLDTLDGGRYYPHTRLSEIDDGSGTVHYCASRRKLTIRSVELTPPLEIIDGDESSPHFASHKLADWLTEAALSTSSPETEAPPRPSLPRKGLRYDWREEKTTSPG